MAIRIDQYTNTINVVDTAIANASLNLVGSANGAVNLVGTGQNLLTYSQNFTNNGLGWQVPGSVSVTIGNTAPNGASTANYCNITNTSNYLASSAITVVPGLTYTFSFYALAGTTTTPNYAIYNVTSSAYILTSTNYYSQINSSTWTRITTTFVVPAGCTQIYTYMLNQGSSLGTITLWGAQLEFGSVANAYVPTTTAAVYGTPQLTFSGVAGIGLQSDGFLYVSPAGNGGLQAQKTDSTTAGGNARGTNAVDWQTARGNANQVASSSYSTLGGGNNNRASGFGSTIAGGEYGVASGVDSIVSGGNSNQATGSRSSVAGGNQNLATGYYNFIGGGQSNSGTTNGSVTTQATTTVTSGSTAVTLSGSNASIKVGQYITGTGINDNTYVAAISGTSLTLSQNATATGTPTLTFYTPHGVVVGGGNNQATGSYSFIGGGGDAGTAANRNTASGAWSFVGGGAKNTASGAGSTVGGGGTDGAGNYFANLASGTSSFIGGGWNNTSSGTLSTIVGGTSNNASGGDAFIGGGDNHTSSGVTSAIIGGRRGTTRGLTGYHAFPACYEPLGSTAGASQAALLILGKQTTDATATVITSDGNAAGTTNQIILPDNSAYFFKGSLIAGVTGAGATAAWEFKGAIKRGSGVASTVLMNSVTDLIAQDSAASSWTFTLTADTTNGGLAVTVTGQASTTIRWVCKIETTEMTY